MKDQASLAELSREEKSFWRGRSEAELLWVRWDLLQMRIFMYLLGNQCENSYQQWVAFYWDCSYHIEVDSSPFQQKSLKRSSLRSPSASIMRLEPLEVMDSRWILVVLLQRQRLFLGGFFTSLRPCLLFFPSQGNLLYSSQREMLEEDMRAIRATVSQLCKLALRYFLKMLPISTIGPFTYSPSYPQSLKKGFIILAVISPFSSSQTKIISSFIRSTSLSSFLRKLIPFATSEMMRHICSLLTTRVLIQLLRVSLGFSNTAQMQFMMEHKLLD